MSKPKASGVCKLTGSAGQFVKAHIIPLALTRLSTDGQKWIEGGLERDGTPLRVLRRPNSWYDDRLVTAAGERLLANIDDQAIRELRALQLVWSGWEGAERLESEDLVVENGQSFRPLRLPNTDILRLFFLSIVWRAAASTLAECRWVGLNLEELDDLRQRVVANDPGPAIDYPIQLFQLITRGPPHNRTPLLETQIVPRRDGTGVLSVDCVRIYLDGLVAYVYLPRRNDATTSGYFGFCLGVQEVALVIAYEFEKSRTRDNMREMIFASEWSRHKSTWTETQVSKAIRSIFTDQGR